VVGWLGSMPKGVVKGSRLDRWFMKAIMRLHQQAHSEVLNPCPNFKEEDFSEVG